MKFVCSDDELFNAIIINKWYLINILRNYFPKKSRKLNDDDFIYEIERCNYFTSHTKKKVNVCKLFINEFEKSLFTDSKLEIDAQKLVHGGNYELPPTSEKINSISDIPSLAQIANNHFKLYLNVDINFFSTTCKLKPLLIRDDNIALVLVYELTSIEMICEPPYHELDGLTLTTSNTHPFTNSKYMSLCVVNLNNKYIQKGVYNNFDEYFNKVHKVHDEHKVHKVHDEHDEKYTLLIYAGVYC